jgi:hypothetical protein
MEARSRSGSTAERSSKKIRSDVAIATACLLVTALVGVAAIVDHRVKQDRMDRAEVSAWFCAHDGSRCRGPSAQGIESSWNERELAYEGVIAVLSGCALLSFGRIAWTRRKPDRAASEASNAWKW